MYKQLTKEDRLRIYERLNRNESLSEIGRAIGKGRSTIAREIKRNREPGLAHIPAGDGYAPGRRKNARFMAHAAAYASRQAAGDAGRPAALLVRNSQHMNARCSRQRHTYAMAAGSGLDAIRRTGMLTIPIVRMR